MRPSRPVCKNMKTSINVTYDKRFLQACNGIAMIVADIKSCCFTNPSINNSSKFFKLHIYTITVLFVSGI